jgi:hypothetical protein
MATGAAEQSQARKRTRALRTRVSGKADRARGTTQPEHQTQAKLAGPPTCASMVATAARPKKPNAPSALTFAHCSEAPGAMAAHGCNGHCGRGEAIAAGAQPSATNTPSRERGEGLNAPSGDKLRTPVATTTGGAAETRERGGKAATRSC